MTCKKTEIKLVHGNQKIFEKMITSLTSDGYKPIGSISTTSIKYTVYFSVLMSRDIYSF